MLRHERQTVAMELAAALQHSRDVGAWHARRPTGTEDSELRWKAAGRPEGARAAERGGQGSAAHSGPARRRRAHGPGSGYSCAADGGTASGSQKAVGHRGARAGHRSAQDLSRLHPGAFGGLRSLSSADGGTVDGSADHLVSRLAPAAVRRADRRQSSFSWSWASWRY